MLFTPVTLVITAEQVGRVVARIAMPRRRIGRSRLAESEAGELQEHQFDRDIAAADGVKQVGATNRSGQVDRVRVERAVAERGELPVSLSEGADHAVFGGGAGINRQRHTGTGRPVVRSNCADRGRRSTPADRRRRR